MLWVTENEIFERNLQHFKISKKYVNKAQCVCPAHNDKQASLTISKGKKCTLFYCHAGCTLENILLAAGLEKKDTFYDIELQGTNWKAYVESREKRKIEAVYSYVSSCNGEYAFTKIRLEGKKLLYGRLENERFTYGLPRSTPRKSLKAIYGDVQAINKAISEGKPIFIPEGEKDVCTLTKQGYVAFTYGGVNDWQSDFAELVQNADVIILADNDKPGKAVANIILQDIEPIVKSAKVIVPMPDIPKADITDYFEAGHTKQEFEEMINAVKEDRKGCDVEVDLMQFHIVANNGKITGVYHNAIFEYVKDEYDIFVCGGTPYIYDGGYFKVDVSGARLKSIIRKLIYPQFVKSTTINNIYALFLQDIELEVDFEELNQYPSHWICFQNGMYDTKTKELVPHNPKYKVINQIPHKYEPNVNYEGKKTEEYLHFICEEQDSREMLLQFMGYALTKDVGQQKFLVLNGEGGTGKSTVIRLMEALVGSSNVSNISLTDLQQRFASFGLMGKLLNSCADLEIQALEDTSIIKKILGEDTLRAEQKGKDAISFKSYAKLIFSTNELPLVKSEKTSGFYRRLLVLTMNKVPLQKNPNLFQELLGEINYLLQLSVQAVERMYQQSTIVVAEASEKAVLQLRADSDTTEAFLQEYCIKDENGRIERTKLYEKYKTFCEDTERQSLTRNNFYKALRVKGYSEITSCGIRYFKGIFYYEKCSQNCLQETKKTALDKFVDLTQEQLFSVPFH